DVLIVSSGVIPLSSLAVSTIQAFLLQGGRVYLQGEYLTSYTTNIAFQQIVNANGGAFSWIGTTSGTLAPMNVMGSLSNTPDTIPPLGYFWYGTNANPGCNSHVESFLEYSGSYYGFIFCVPTNNSRMITTSDQDWVQSGTSIPLMQNMALNLASPTYTCVVTGGLNVSLGPDTSICNGQAVILDGTAATATGYLWSTGETSPSITTDTSGTYWVQVTNGFCTTSDTIVISAGSTFTITAGPDTTVCVGNALQLSASTVGGATYSWTGPNNFNTQNPVIPATAFSDSGTYTVIANNSGCSSNPVNVHVSITPGPSAPTVSNNSPVCSGDSLLLSASFVAGATYTWTGPNNFGQQNPLIPSASLSDSGTYTVVLTIGSCSSNPVTTQVIINPAPAPPIIAASDTVICAGDSSQLCIVGTFASYSWNNGAGTQCIYARIAGNYYASVTDANGCKAESNHLALNVNPVPPVSISVNGDTLTCYTPGTYQWYLSGNPISGATSPVYIAPQQGLYTILVTSSNGCSALSSPVAIGSVDIVPVSGNTIFEVYPNPTSNQLTVQLSSDVHSVQIEMFDALGQRVSQTLTDGPKTEINVSEFATGIYFIKIGGSVRKFVKQ
ncbi:MAG: hypothetical protein JWO06_1869, partial [Bacteroidota bacterium]|nr:hypothetical protein [Bacteroidota bacterium]